MTTVVQEAALARAVVRTVYFAEFQFVSGTAYVSSAGAPISWGNVQSGTAQAGSASALTLAAAASAVDGSYVGQSLHLTDGSDRRRNITAYVGATRVATVDERWQTNLFTQSQDATQSDWVKTNSSISATLYSAPDGTITANKLTESSGAGPHIAALNFTSTISPYTISIYAKAAERTKCQIGVSSNFIAGGANGSFDLVAGTAQVINNCTVAIEPADGGWYRCSITFTPTAATTAGAFFYVLDAAGTTGYTGDGTSGFLLWGAQSENASIVGDYVPTLATIIGLPTNATPYEVGRTWVGLGGIGSVDAIQESDSLDAQSLSFTLNAAQSSWLALASGSPADYRGRPAKLYFCPLDENFQLIGTPQLCWRGNMDTISIGVEGEAGNIILRCETSAYGLKRRSSLRVNAAQQKKKYPDDTGLDYLTSLIAQPQLWLSKKFQQQ